MNLKKLIDYTKPFLFLIIVACSGGDDIEPINEEEIETSTLKENLLLDYSFKNNFKDNSDNGFHAVNFGSKFTEDRFGKENEAVLFDGVDDYLELPNDDKLKPALPLSISFWIRYDSDELTDRDVFNTSFENNRNTGVYFNSQSSTGNYAINIGDGSFQYSTASRRTAVAEQAIETNVWNHVVLVLESENLMKVYVNGVNIKCIDSGEGDKLAYSDLPGCIGRHDRSTATDAYYFKGAMDSFKYWDRSLDDQEVIELFELVE